MGFLNKLFGSRKDNNGKQDQQSAEIAVIGTAKQAVQTNQSILSVHSDIRDLVWIGDGEFKNYVPMPSKKNIICADGITLTISFGIEEEPSLLYLSLPISDNSGIVERPPYYPTYRGLTPEQRCVYWTLLANPYDNTIDIGYVFIMYYGLERYLLTEKYEEAVDVILKLRDVHQNKSFQMYSANAIILTCMAKRRVDVVQRFMNSLDKEHEFAFSPNLYLLCKHTLGLPLTAEDMMRMAKAFEFTKTNYIRKHPDIFLEVLSQNITQAYREKEIPWGKLLSNTDFKKLPSEETLIFANVSIRDKTIRVPSFLSSFRLKKNIYNLLDKTNEDVKHQLAEMKKDGIIIHGNDQVPASVKPKEEMKFDAILERKLRTTYSNAKNNPMERHFASISLQDFYYKYRDLDQAYLDACIRYCKEDISQLEELQKCYYDEEQKRIKAYSYLSSNEIKQRLSEITPFCGTIPAFKRLAIIYEKRKDYNNAIDICNQAIEYYNLINNQSAATEFCERRQKLLEKA
ncbi:MAG: TerB N-terminal domain-containing protein [Clostridiales bacterium]|nr:TerB N-terminal domain-containing protein [Clostridiales bacterium]